MINSAFEWFEIALCCLIALPAIALILIIALVMGFYFVVKAIFTLQLKHIYELW